MSAAIDTTMLSQDVRGDRRALVLEAARRGVAYLADIRERRVMPDRRAIADLSHLHSPLPDSPVAAAEVLALLDWFGTPATIANAGGRYFGFVNGGSLPAALAANVLAAAWDQNAGLRVMSPVAAVLEDIVLEWLRDLFRLPSDAAGSLVTGATAANLTCLAAARHALLAKRGWDVEAQGLFGAPPITVVVGEEYHISVQKALALLGFGRDRVLKIPADDQGRMRPGLFPRLDSPALVCIQAGNVNSGAFDPAGDICRLARESGSWVHVDGAFGLWAACSPARAHLVEGFSDADSWATDAHTWLNVPYDCGLAFVRDSAALHRAMSAQAAYLQPGVERDPNQWTPEMSRRARGVEVWAALKSLGRSGLAELIERTCRHAKRFANALQDEGYEILNDVVINQVLVSFRDDQTTQAVIEGVQREGTCWCGGTIWHGKTAMRISVSSWLTDEQDVEKSLEAILRMAR
jgi:glutamate/tyrosine decarboxylase-like PLP-dependent enzyme